MNYQVATNEAPFYPPSAEFGLGLEYRNSTDNYVAVTPDPIETIAANNPLGGGWEQRHASYETLMKSAVLLTNDQIENSS
jgi:hypothetical protein